MGNPKKSNVAILDVFYHWFQSPTVVILIFPILTGSALSWVALALPVPSPPRIPWSSKRAIGRRMLALGLFSNLIWFLATTLGWLPWGGVVFSPLHPGPCQWRIRDALRGQGIATLSCFGFSAVAFSYSGPYTTGSLTLPGHYKGLLCPWLDHS